MKMKIEEFITTKIEMVDAKKSLYDAIERMVDRRIRSLVVQFSEDKNDYGVITARDIIFKVLAKKIDPKDVKVSEIASKPIVRIEQGADLFEVSKIMEEANVARIFVCENKKIIGVVSLIDIMDAVLIMRAKDCYVS
ncbi:CBS domain-containing protein [Candidatus Magnetomoraceae bacterium gMMP-15]